MNKNQVFIGDIRKCTQYISNYSGPGGCLGFPQIETNDEIYKENAILIKLKNRCYIDLEKLNSISNYIDVLLNSSKHGGYAPSDLILGTSAYREGTLFVDEKSLKPYYEEHLQKGKISARQLKKELKMKK